ncbi:MAG: hypothetical protein HKN31_05645 [Pricia sp.]|nr:hypothetical protein [Pricia sp.]
MAKRINYFLSYIRQGVTTLADHSQVKGRRTTLPIKLTLAATHTDKNTNKAAVVEKEITLYGPGDILGINTAMISRLGPPNNSTNFESSLTPFIEFSEADFLWRFSSRQTADKKNWIPWLALIILKREHGEEEGEFVKVKDGNKQLPPQIQLKPNAILPDLNESWRWAHAHKLDSEGASIAQLESDLKTTPDKTVCRLLGPRRLKPQTKYHAFLVPAFKIGMEAAMGITEGVEDRTLLSWDTPDEGAGKALPYYFDWEFSMGSQGDFENLVRKLKPRDLEQMGTRPVDCSNPGYGMDEENGLELHLEAALKSLDTDYQAWGVDDTDGNNTTSQKKRLALANLLNKREEKTKKENGDVEIKLRVTPPVYGEWYASRQGETLDPNDKTRWLEELNLDFRHRAAAGLGVQFVKENQENLMKAAFTQLSTIKEVNQELNLGRFGRQVSLQMFRRLTHMEKTNVFQMALPVQHKIAFKSEENESTKTIGSFLRSSDVTNNLAQIKLKKYLSKGKVSKEKSTFKPIDTHVLVKKGFEIKGLKTRLSTTLKSTPIAKKTISAWPEGMIDATISSLDPKNTIESLVQKRISRFRALEKTESSTNGSEDALHPVLWYPEFHRPMYRFLRELSQEYILPGLERIPQNTVGLLQTNRRFIEAFMLGLNHEMASELRWREFPTDMRGSYFRSFWDTSIYSVDDDEKEEFTETPIGLKLLDDLKKKYGNDFNTFSKIEQAYTKGNPSDTEKEVADAYENAIEEWLLTREADKDIDELVAWKNNNRLGENPVKGNLTNSEEDENRLVLLVRGELLLKFNNTLIYLVENKEGKPDLGVGANRIFPVFEGQLPPDIVFIGFPIQEKDTVKYHVIFEERMTELRFGLDETPEGDTPGTSEKDFSWQHFPSLSQEGYLDGKQPTIFNEDWNNAAFIGKVMMQKQVRAAIRLKTLLPEKSVT